MGSAPQVHINNQHLLTMTSLNSKLQLAVLNRKKSRNLLEKGFTLVELMIVIVIVGVLSAVALPNFLGQQTKAKITEATSKISSILKASHAEYTYSGLEADAVAAALTESTNANKAGVYTYTPSTVSGAVATAPLAPTKVLIVSATPNANDSAASGKFDTQLETAAKRGGSSVGKIYGCINLDTGEIDVARDFRDTVEAKVDGTGTASNTLQILDCA